MSSHDHSPAHWSLMATTSVANLIALPWWAWCLVPPSHNVFARSNSFAAMRGVAGQAAWGAVVLVLWLVLLLALYGNHTQLRIVANLGCAMFWALVAAMLFASNSIATGVGPYVAFSVLSGWRAAKLIGEA